MTNYTGPSGVQLFTIAALIVLAAAAEWLSQQEIVEVALALIVSVLWWSDWLEWWNGARYVYEYIRVETDEVQSETLTCSDVMKVSARHVEGPGKHDTAR